MNIKFGTDGWRGRIARDFTFDNVARVIQAFCDVFPERKVPSLVFLGFDRRFLSQQFSETAAQVLCANGIEVRMSKQFCPTPCISWMVKQYEAGAGVIITASHNSFEWNGVKFKEPGGGAASNEYTAPIEVRIQENRQAGREPKMMSLEEAAKKKLLSLFDPLGPYVEQLRTMVDIEAIRKAGWNIVVDSMFGSGTGFFEAVLGETVKDLHGDDNPSFGSIQPEPIEKNLTELTELVGHEGIDLGLATDGDADRIGAVDETGRFIDSHHIFALIMRHLVLRRKMTGDVVKTVSTTEMINRVGEKLGTKVHETPVGFKHISAKFKEITRLGRVPPSGGTPRRMAGQAPLMGGEESGGICVYQHVPERDGILSGLILLEIMTVEKKTLSKIIHDLEDEVGPHRFRRDDFSLSEEKVKDVRTKIKDFSMGTLADVAVKEINRMDGCRLNLEDGSWALIRASGTEPLVRIYAESGSDEQTAAMLQAVQGELGL